MPASGYAGEPLNDKMVAMANQAFTAQVRRDRRPIGTPSACRRVLSVVVAALALLLHPGCGGDSSGEPPTTSGVARTDVIDALLHGPVAGITVAAGGSIISPALFYGDTVSRELLSWFGGAVKLLPFEARNSGNGVRIVGPVDVPLEDLGEYAAVVLGDLNAAGAYAADILVFEKDLTVPAPLDIRITLVHALPNVLPVPGAAEFDLHFQGTEPLTKVISNVAYKTRSSYAVVRPAAGNSNRLVVVPAGFGVGAALVDIGDLSFTGGKSYIAVLRFLSDAPLLLTDATLDVIQQLP